MDALGRAAQYRSLSGFSEPRTWFDIVPAWIPASRACGAARATMKDVLRRFLREVRAASDAAQNITGGVKTPIFPAAVNAAYPLKGPTSRGKCRSRSSGGRSGR